MTTGPEVYEPVSLGFTCETKFQISRVAHMRRHPDASEMVFRYDLRQPDHAAATFGWRLFDWQSTPLKAVCEYIERDFQGLFELEDLKFTELGVSNVRFDTLYAHEFTPLPGETDISPARIAEQYPAAKARFDRLTSDFKRLLRRPGPYLYVLSHPQFPTAAEVEHLVDALSAWPEHRFHLLVLGHEGFDNDLSSLGDRVTKAWRPQDDRGKPAKFWWEGHDLSWDHALSPFALGFHEDGFHDPTTPEDGDMQADAAVRRHGPAPAADAEVRWRGGPAALVSYQFWRDAGAELEIAETGAAIRTPPVAWHYSHAVHLGLNGFAPETEHGWVCIRLTGVSGPLLVSLYDPEGDSMAEETLVPEGAGPFVLNLMLRDASKPWLLVRTGNRDEAAAATVLDVEVLCAPA